MTTIKTEGVLDEIEALAGLLVARVDQPAIGLEQHRRSEIAIAIPPIARAGGRATGAENALVEAVQLVSVFGRLAPLLLRGGRRRLQPRLDRSMLRVEPRKIRHEVFDYEHVRQRIDLDGALHLADALGAGKRIGAIDVHRAGAADAFAARAAEGQRRVDFRFDPDDRVEHHRPAIIDVDEIGVDARVLPVFRVPAVDAELLQVRSACRLRPGLTRADLGVLGEVKLNHR